MYKIGFIDEDEKDRLHFRQTFKDEFEIYSIEFDKNSTEDDLIREAFDSQVDILVIDYRMDAALGFNGDSIARRLDEINPYFPKIIWTSHEGDAINFVDNVNLINDKDDSTEKPDFFISKFNRLINDYYEDITNAEEKLRILEEKRKTEGLTSYEEQEYVGVNNFLGKVFGGGEYLSGTFYSVDTNKKLDSLIEKTEQLLNKLSENNESV